MWSNVVFALELKKFIGKQLKASWKNGNTKQYQVRFRYKIDGKNNYGDTVNVTKEIEELSLHLGFNESGTTVEPFTFTFENIQIEEGSIATPFQKHQESKAIINGEFAGIKVSSGGNYTDQNGEQWICDEIVKYADGSGEDTQRIYKKVFNGTENITVNTTSSGGGYYFSYSDNLFYSPLNQNTMPNAICNKLLPTTGNALWSNDVPKFALYENSGSFRFRFPNLGITTVGDMKAKLLEWYKNGEPLVVISEIREPITTPLTAEELAEISTFYPVTNISNDFDCGMKVKYNADSKNYIDKQLAEMERAREQAMMSMFLLLPEETQATMIENDVNNLLTESEN
jgi:hypothetical protein